MQCRKISLLIPSCLGAQNCRCCIYYTFVYFAVNYQPAYTSISEKLIMYTPIVQLLFGERLKNQSFKGNLMTPFPEK